MSDHFKINLNAIVEVELTEEGLEVFSKYTELAVISCGDGTATSTGAIRKTLDSMVKDGSMKEPLWKLFQIFGPFIDMSMYTPFKNNVLTVFK